MVDNVVMPEDLSIGFTSSPTFATTKARMVSGRRVAFRNRSLVIHRYEFTLQDAPKAMVASLREFWFDRAGDYRTFLMKDWADYELEDEPFGVADGIETIFQAKKTYGSNAPYERTIRHLVSGYTVKNNGVTVSPGDYSEVLGSFAFFAPPSAGTLTITGEFLVPVAFDGDQFPVSVNITDISLLSVLGLRAEEILP